MNYPTLTHYDQNHLARIALPLGGIGTGTISLGGRGDLRDFEVYSHPDKGFTPGNTFFALWAKPAGGDAITRCLEGAIEPWLYEGTSGCAVPNHGLPRFRHCTFDAAYPFGQVHLSDPDVPLQVRLEAFNPLIPTDAEASGIPAAILRFVLINPTDQPVIASICGSLPNFIGNDGSDGKRAKQNTITFRQGAGLSGLFYEPGPIDPNAEQHGTMSLIALTPDPSPTGGGEYSPPLPLGEGPGVRVSSRTAWHEIGWATGLLDFWDDFSADGTLEPRRAAHISGAPMGITADTPIGSLAVQVTVPAGDETTAGTAAVTFLITWHFPNRKTWTPCKPGETCNCPPDQPDFDTIGNYYATRYRDAWDVATRTAANLTALEEKTARFVRAFCESSLPHTVKEAALFNLSTLRTQTAFRTPDGRLYGWEGCHDKAGCCHGSCTHVWNYEQSTAFLFGELSRTMREVEFAFATDETGLMCFRSGLPLVKSREWVVAAADGQMGCLMKLYRDWQLSGDEAWLRALWPKAKKALEFCWIPGGWDADMDGVMEGCQHNTMDVEYYGPNPQMQAWYLGALRAAEEMAWHLNENKFSEKCRAFFEQGSAWMDAHLFNGEYYEHEIRPILDPANIAPGLRAGMGAADLADPAFQIGAGCLVDQLVGQYMAHVCGLGYLLQPGKVQKALRSIYKYNRRANFHNHFNNMRSYVLGDEAALLMCSYPHGKRPRQPFSYANEVMTGFEYTAAVGMLYEGQVRAGLRVIGDVRERYDGRKRSPFDEAECGHHYARAMAAWAAVLALTDFNYSAVDQTMIITAEPGTHFWSNGYAYGTCRIEEAGEQLQATLTVEGGTLALRKVILSGWGEAAIEAGVTLTEGQTVTCLCRAEV
jgi:uncharacterized protein (DUF608 family)